MGIHVYKAISVWNHVAYAKQGYMFDDEYVLNFGLCFDIF